MSKKKFTPHFRYNYARRHPAFIYDEFNDEYKYIGLTHSPTTYGHNNIKLRGNPNPNDHRASYMRPFSTHQKKRKFAQHKLFGFKLNKTNKKIASKIKKNYRQ